MTDTDRDMSSTAQGEPIKPPYQLIYYSTSLVPALHKGGREEIEKIFTVAVKQNARRGLTGALAFNENFFAQVLEGPHEAVTETFGSISKDRRHTKINILQEGFAEARDFAHWAMAYVEDEASMHVMSTRLQLQDILSKEREKAAMSLLEMMKFFLLRSA